MMKRGVASVPAYITINRFCLAKSVAHLFLLIGANNLWAGIKIRISFWA